MEVQDAVQTRRVGRQITPPAGRDPGHQPASAVLPEPGRCRPISATSRVGADEFTLTHEFLAAMLGVRRATVTVAAGILQQAEPIDYRRGRMHILDRERLREAACQDYRLTQDIYDRPFRSVDGTGSPE